ncbi:MAG: hypothetical protein DSM106950_33490 [Stigonema ocellatum SAG 48.90 = DSM 106950]|nr:hypothetical protein [Stigonema ocellatum SAG 48.90 = DSM 106950]
MVSQPDKIPEKIRIKDSYRERIFAESQELGKNYLETLYFIIDCYFAFKHGAFPMQSAVKIKPQPQQNRTLAHEQKPPSTNVPIEVDSDEGITLDWDL